MYEEEFDDNQDYDIQDLIDKYENAIKNKEQLFFSSDAFEQLIDFYEDHGQWKKAELIIDIAMEQYPYMTEFLCRKAEILLEKGHNTEAEILIDKAIALDPLDYNTYFLKSDLFCNLEQYDYAIDTLNYALKYASEEDVADIHIEKADVYEEWGDFENAFKSIKKAILFDPKNEEALDRIWFHMEYLNNYEECKSFFNQIIDKDPYNFNMWYNLGNAYLGLENLPEAIDAFEMVIAINENYSYAYEDLGDIYMKMEDYEKAIDFYEKAIEFGEPTEELYFQIGQCYQFMKQYSKARAQFRKATRLDHEYDDAYFEIGKSFYLQEDFDKAIHAFERALKINENEPEYYFYLALALFKTEDYVESGVNSTNVTEIKYNHLQAWILLIVNLYKLNEWELLDNIFPMANDKCDQDAALEMLNGVLGILMGKYKEGELKVKNSFHKSENELQYILTLLPELEKNRTFLNCIIE